MNLRQLPVPPAAEADPKAFELLRVWVANGDQCVTLATGIWDDPASWGIMLVDLAKHIASAYQQAKGKDYEQVLLRIKEGFDAEWGTATDEPAGEIVS